MVGRISQDLVTTGFAYVTLVPMYSTFEFTSPDGTVLEGWTNNGTGPPILVCNGLGVSPEAWPRLLDPECGYRVVGYNHRGTMGSARPDDPSRIRIDDHVADALAVLDHTGIDKALLVAWSYGVNVSFELTREHPDRVAGLVMCAGVPGGTLDSAFAPLLIPRQLRKPISLAVAKAGELIGPQLNALAKFVPVNRTTADVMRYTGMIMPSARSEDIVPWLDSFVKQDFAWYFHLFPAAGEHERIDPSFVEVPVTVAAGGMDALTSMLDVVAFAKEIEHAQIHVLRGTHFIPLEFPDEIMAMIDDVLIRSQLAPEQVVEQRTSVIDIRTYDGQTYYEHKATAFHASEQSETKAKETG